MMAIATWTREDDLFTALDRLSLIVGDRVWQIIVYGIRQLEDGMWIQLDLIGSPTFVLTIRQPALVDSVRIATTLTHYISRSDATDDVVFDRIMTELSR